MDIYREIDEDQAIDLSSERGSAYRAVMDTAEHMDEYRWFCELSTNDVIMFDEANEIATRLTTDGWDFDEDVTMHLCQLLESGDL